MKFDTPLIKSNSPGNCISNRDELGEAPVENKTSLGSVLLSIFLTVAALPGPAQADPASDANKTGSEQVTAIVVIDENADQNPVEQGPQEDILELVYDPSLLDPKDAVLELGKEDLVSYQLLQSDSLKLKQELHASEEAAKAAEAAGNSAPRMTEVRIPIGSEDEQLLKNALDLSPTSLDTFVRKKTVFIEKTAKGLQALKLSKKMINKTLRLMNSAFYRNAAVFAEANTKVTNVQLGVALGAGLPDWLMRAIRKSPYLKDVPERLGFYFMLSSGFSVVNTTVNGKRKLSIEPVIDVRRATRIFGPFAFGAAGFTGSYTWENRENEKSAIQKIGFLRFSSLNVLSSSNHFGFSASAAFAFPPGGGAVAGMEGDIYRFRLTPSNFSQMIRSLLTTVRGGSPGRCEAAF